MNYNFPNKTMNSPISEIRLALEKMASMPNCISFGIGNPAPEAIPEDEIVTTIKEIIADNPMKILQYGPFSGYKPLADYTLDTLINYLGLKQDDNSLTFLNGSGHGLGLMPRAFCNEGDVVFADEFTFPNGINAARAVGCVVKSIKMDEYGMIPTELEKAILSSNGKGRYIYIIPNFQNPTGLTIPLERRKVIYDIASKHNLLIYEDDPYGAIRFSGKQVPAFKSLDIDGRVIFAGSYSKVLSAGLRVGYLYGHNSLISKIAALKASSDGQMPIFNQMIVYHTLEKLDYKPYIQSICDTYGKKCKIMVDALTKYCHPDFTFKEPEGGMFLWLNLPHYINPIDFVDKCLENDVCVITSKGFATEPEKNIGHSLRLNYTAISDENIDEGIKRLGKASYDIITSYNKLII
ncbi:MAG: hypothetical protein ATN33_08065 [Epulopiscium sp. Nele67-Bin001]|nr:MAG: hypothetical protein ATN33_08065 [Epulopiscium sp. Nele67-Bin001]